jgi:hypothetical protein
LQATLCAKPPWPITKEELALFREADLRQISFEGFLDAEVPPVRRFRVSYAREEEDRKSHGRTWEKGRSSN